MTTTFFEADPGVAGPEFFSLLPASCRFLLVRHGQSEGNARQIVQGRLDLPLDQKGRSQAGALAPWIGAQEPAVILASPLVRADETARILLGGCSPRPRFRNEALLAELDTGPFTGLSLDEAALRHPEAHANFLRESWDGVPGAEASVELYARALRVWELLREEALGGASTVVVVTHGGFLQWLIKATMGVRGWMPLFPMSNCGVSEFDATPQPGGGVLLNWRRIDWQAPGVAAAVAPLF
ncbi:MAG TPA: histidine phosphatase family protein [Rectinemataceae bacterium]|nr:histidine phosphatase family protein [Rectinemataceae bacterium]